MISISQNIEKKRATNIWKPLYKGSIDLLKEVEDYQVKFQSSWIKWIFLGKQDYKKTEDSYKTTINDIKDIIILTNKIIETDNQNNIEELEQFILDIRCNSQPQNRHNFAPGFITNIFEILPIVTMTIMPSLIQAGLLSLNLFIIGCSITIGVLLFLIKIRNVTYGIVQNIQKEDAWILHQTYNTLIYYYKLPSKFHERVKSTEKLVLDEKPNLETQTFFFQIYQNKNKAHTYHKRKKYLAKSPSFSFRSRHTKNKTDILDKKKDFLAYA